MRIVVPLLDQHIPMLEKTPSLSSKIRICCDHEKLANFSENQVRFYLKYSSFVLRVLRKPSFQKFLHWMLKKETIKEQAVNAVHKVLPMRRKNGKGIAGKCDTNRGRIRIYPKTTKFCRTFSRKFGRNTLLAYAGNRARVALIHELLHLKYIEDEKTVRELSKEYFYIFTRKQYTQSAHSLVTYTMIFNAKTSGKKAHPRVFCNDTCLRANGVFNQTLQR
ncbi:MAG: hypothetical protein NWE99_06720 [Candidatus Bathyarchaeota archaeon]|nr:hypothetical protein [Candidatus Bathyarchaeota archaeon]